MSALRFRIEAPAVPASVLRQLGPPPSWSIDQSIVELLGPACKAAGTLARGLALGAEGGDGAPGDDGTRVGGGRKRAARDAPGILKADGPHA